MSVLLGDWCQRCYPYPVTDAIAVTTTPCTARSLTDDVEQYPPPAPAVSERGDRCRRRRDWRGVACRRGPTGLRHQAPRHLLPARHPASRSRGRGTDGLPGAGGALRLPRAAVADPSL